MKKCQRFQKVLTEKILTITLILLDILNSTPHVSLGKLSIGSRPSKRKNVDNIKSLRAIPWIFAWTQIRLMLPAWLGSAEALRYANIKDFRKILYDMERNWPFFQFNARYFGYGNFKS